MLNLEQLETIIRDNHLPAEICDSGQTWVKVALTDEQTGLGRVELMGMSEFVNLVLHWREHHCHEHPCPGLILQEHQRA